MRYQYEQKQRYNKPWNWNSSFVIQPLSIVWMKRIIRHAFETCRYMGQYGDRNNVYLLLGFDTKANPVEILYNEVGDNIVNVFHAMPCQSRFLRLFEEETS